MRTISLTELEKVSGGDGSTPDYITWAEYTAQLQKNKDFYLKYFVPASESNNIFNAYQAGYSIGTAFYNVDQFVQYLDAMINAEIQRQAAAYAEFMLQYSSMQM